MATIIPLLILLQHFNLRGVWQIVEITTTTPKDSTYTYTPAEGSYFTFGSKYYSWMEVPSSKARPGAIASTSDSLKLAVFNNFIANAGTYRLQGNHLVLDATTSKNANHLVFDFQLERSSKDLVASYAFQGFKNRLRLKRLE